MESIPRCQTSAQKTGIEDFLKEDYFEPEIMEAMPAAYRMARGAPQLKNAA
jgi:hypothetical protein